MALRRILIFRSGSERKSESVWALKQRDKLDANIQKHCWDGKWFIWAIGEDGTVYGTQKYDEGQVYLNTQVWAVISGAASPEQAKLAMETVKAKLATPYGLMLSAPPFVKTSVDVMRAVVFNSGIKENGGIFNHTQGWGIIAEAMLGDGARAYEYCKAALPAAWNDKAEIRQMEPYVQGQTTYSPCSPRAGNTRTSWLSGAAALVVLQSHAVYPRRASCIRRASARPVRTEGLERIFRCSTVPRQECPDRIQESFWREQGPKGTHIERRETPREF